MVLRLWKYRVLSFVVHEGCVFGKVASDLPICKSLSLSHHHPFVTFMDDSKSAILPHTHIHTDKHVTIPSWISTYMLVGTAKECSSVGQAGADHKDTVEAVITELLGAVEAKEGIKFPDGAVQRLAAYTDVVTDFPCAVKEFEWRNQYFYNLGDEACPTHNGLLRECAEKGFLGFELP